MENFALQLPRVRDLKLKYVVNHDQRCYTFGERNRVEKKIPITFAFGRMLTVHLFVVYVAYRVNKTTR